ncbi:MULTISPECIES: 4-alpha-glucanotransferase [unclassified Saccharicrinis]|uniref:4-alpha-glucanotransferase n=1 Tax=unclassified Saccharicrinis TaxID=2646859 RepID=UPI003D338891
MQIIFNIHYHTLLGQNIYVCGSNQSLGKWKTSKALKLSYANNGDWTGECKINTSDKLIEYKYFVQDESGNIIWEWGVSRELSINKKDNKSVIVITDNWRAPLNEEKIMYSSAFRKVIMKPSRTFNPPKNQSDQALEFKINVPRIGTNHRLCIIGNQKVLGNWDLDKPLLMGTGNNFPEWCASIDLNKVEFPLSYKYAIYNSDTKKISTIEEGEDRQIGQPEITEKKITFVKQDESFKYPFGNWKGAGVAVPVFSLRSKDSFGVGEFNDLFAFIDWAKSVGMKMVQLLPVNETIASHNWLDSYPYKSISVMALHPLYLNLGKMGKLKDKKMMEGFEALSNKLNSEIHVNYPEVLRAKSEYYKLLFDQEKETFFDDKAYISFFKKNKKWLIPYAAFAYLRDKMKNPDFRQWTEHSTYDEKAILKISAAHSNEWDDIAVHYFIQYHLDKQLKEVSEYARKNGVVLKGDIPIGISPNSVEAWTEPHLFHLNGQAGAPPDDFAVKGQNWGFPTYNWEAMAKDKYRWWIDRLQKMADYFDAYRIDHILGFFRIWEIPSDAVEGLMGHFKPALPMTVQEIESYHIVFDYERYVKPYIKHHIVEALFNEHAPRVINDFLEDTGHGNYQLKQDFDSQLKVNAYFLQGIEEEDLSITDREIRDGLFDLISNVLIVQTGENEFHPRICVHNTSSFAELDDHTKGQMSKLYFHFFYQRHDDFWYHQAMNKLPQIIEASDMLVCGEDLGMVPDCVPPVMEALNILSLEIQRMSKNSLIKFAHPADAPYLSVCTTSTHDMSTIRGWWEEDKESIQDFYNNQLGNHGEAPFYAEPEICLQIITQHMYSPAMWTIFPIQDLIALDGDLRWRETHEEQINYPSNVRHRWRFRMQQSIQELKEATDLNALLKNLIEDSGRNTKY